MKCSNKKCKGVSLDVARTYTDSSHVNRDRRCPRCGIYYKTIEMFVSDHEIEINKLKSEIHDRESKITDLNIAQQDVKDSLSLLFRFSGIGLKVSKKT
jgi:transcriptional regulator NrdR family protein